MLAAYHQCGLISRLSFCMLAIMKDRSPSVTGGLPPSMVPSPSALSTPLAMRLRLTLCKNQQGQWIAQCARVQGGQQKMLWNLPPHVPLQGQVAQHVLVRPQPLPVDGAGLQDEALLQREALPVVEGRGHRAHLHARTSGGHHCKGWEKRAEGTCLPEQVVHHLGP